MDTLDLLMHPVRLRVVHAMSGGRILTTSDLCARLPDVPKTTVYRHVALLAGAGVLEVEGEQRVHGAVERRYRLRRERTVIDREAAASMSLEDHRRLFAAAMAALLAEFNTYLDRDRADPTADSVGYRQIPLWLSQAELAELIGEMRSAIVSKLDNKPTPDRSLHLLSPILFPIEEPSAHRTGKQAATATEPGLARAGPDAQRSATPGPGALARPAASSPITPVRQYYRAGKNRAQDVATVLPRRAQPGGGHLTLRA